MDAQPAADPEDVAVAIKHEPGRRPPQSGRNKRIGIVAGVVLLLAIAVGVGYWWLRELRPRDTSRATVATSSGTTNTSESNSTGSSAGEDGDSSSSSTSSEGDGLPLGFFDSDDDIALNSVGFLPNGPKLATIETATCGKPWTLYNTANGRIVATGSTRPFVFPDESGTSWFPPFFPDDVLCLANFTAFSSPGTYRLEVKDAGKTEPFVIADHPYDVVLDQVMGYFYLARCGMKVTAIKDTRLVTHADRTGRPFEHDECHLADGHIDLAHTGEEGDERVKDGTGGWHDAGDHGKYTVNTAFTIGMMLYAWEHYADQLRCMQIEGIKSLDDDLPYYLDELKWGLDWVLKMQADDGRVYHKLTAEKFESPWEMPDADDAKRWYAPWGTAATANLVAVAAQASRTFGALGTHDDYAATLLAAARLSYAKLKETPEPVIPDQSEFSTGMYIGVVDGNPHHDVSIRLWAAAELYETTGEVEFLEDFEDMLRTFDTPTEGCTGSFNRSTLCKVPDEVDWNQQRNMGVFRYLLLSEDRRGARDPDLVAEAERQLALVVDRFLRTADRHEYSRTLGNFTKWGVNGEVVRQTLFFRTAELVLGNQTDYARAHNFAVDHVLGRNEYARSYITKVGTRPAKYPHHRPSFAYLDAWPGMMIGGPNPRWWDFWVDYKSNEIAINWQAGLVYAFAHFYGACAA